MNQNKISCRFEKVLKCIFSTSLGVTVAVILRIEKENLRSHCQLQLFEVHVHKLVAVQ